MLRPLCSGLAAKGLTANQVTGAALVLSLIYGAWIWFSNASQLCLMLMPLCLLVRMALNAIDGMLAREFDMKSRFGALFNEVADVLSDAALYLPFALITAPEHVVIIVFLAITAEMTGVMGPMIGAQRQYQGPFGKSDRAAFFGISGFLLGTDIIGPALFGIALWAALILSIVTIGNRVKGALKEGSQP